MRVAARPGCDCCLRASEAALTLVRGSHTFMSMHAAVAEAREFDVRVVDGEGFMAMRTAILLGRC